MTNGRSTPRGKGGLWLLIVLALGGICFSHPSEAQIDVWIDPGHGGADPGSVGIDGGNPPNEQDLALLVSQKLNSRLGQIGIISLLMRHSAIKIENSDRPLIAAGLLANDAGDTQVGTCCVSVHMNSVADSVPFGTEVIYPRKKSLGKSRRAYAPDSTFSGDVFSAVQSNLALAFMGCNQPRESRKDTRSLAVMNGSRVPTIIVECCFISNRCQFNKIVVAGNQALVANGIATGVSNFLFSVKNLPPEESGTPPVSAPATIVPTPLSIQPGTVLAASLQEGFESGTFPPPG